MASSQRDIFNKLKAVKSTQSLPPYESPVSQNMDNMGITDFLFELIKQSKGQEGLKNIVLKSTLGELNNNANINSMVFNVVKEVFFCFFDVVIPESAVEDHDGFIFNISEIDVSNMLSIDPNSPEGRRIYEGNDPAKNLNYLIYTSFTSDTPVSYIKNKKTIFTLQYLGGNEFKLHIGSTYSGLKLSEWAEDYLQDVSFFNMPNFIAQLVDIMTGIVSIKTGRSQESIEQLAKIQKVMQKLFGYCKNNTTDGQILEPIIVSPNSYLENQENKRAISGNLFNFTPEDILDIEDISSLRSRGMVRFSTCGNFEITVDPDLAFNGLSELFADSMLSGSTISYVNPNNTSEILTAQKYDNETVTPNLDNTVTYLNGVLYDNIEKYADNESANQNGSTSANGILANLPNMEMEFELNVIKAIPFALTQFIISPQLLLLIKISSLIVGDGATNNSLTVENIVNKLETFITKIGNDIWNSILNNIFNVLIKDLTGILSGLAGKYLSQRFSDYTAILTYIMNLINGITLSANGCQSMLDTITRLLSLNYFGPTLPIPPPLVFAGGLLKPGLNQVSVVNDLKSELANKGIEVGAYLSDGTPNYLMASMEILTETLIKHIKLDTKVDVMVNGITGPAIGYAQLS